MHFKRPRANHTHLFRSEHGVSHDLLQLPHHALRQVVPVKLGQTLDEVGVAQHALGGVPSELVAAALLLLKMTCRGSGLLCVLPVASTCSR